MSKTSVAHVLCQPKTGTVMNVFCDICKEELPITKPLKIDTLVAVMDGFASAHKECKAPTREENDKC